MEHYIAIGPLIQDWLEHGKQNVHNSDNRVKYLNILLNPPWMVDDVNPVKPDRKGPGKKAGDELELFKAEVADMLEAESICIADDGDSSDLCLDLPGHQL